MLLQFKVSLKMVDPVSKDGYILFRKEVLEKLHCVVCSNYLSCGPIRLLPNSGNICGKCTTQETAIHEVALEAVLKNALFPCSYQDYGCPDLLLFRSNDHEFTCYYRFHNCPVANCIWKGSCIQFFNHFKEVHPECVIDSRQFKIDFDKSKEEVLMFCMEAVDFIIKYSYDSNTGDLMYGLMYCTSAVLGAFCRIRIINCFDKEYNINLKGHVCNQFSTSMFDNANQADCKTLNMNKFFEALEKPASVIIEISITLIKSNSIPDLVEHGSLLTSSFPSAFNLNSKTGLESKKRSLRLTKSLQFDSSS